MRENDIQHIALKFLRGETTPEEEALLHAWYESKGPQDEEFLILTDRESRTEVKDRLFRNIQGAMHDATPIVTTSVFQRNRWLAYAASLIFILSFSGLYFYINGSFDSEIHYTQLLKNDVGPGGSNAILELEDGTKINLDQAAVGDLAANNGMVVSKLADGKLAFEVSKAPNQNKVQLNTIRTPKGGQYEVKLPDGTEVWLNASSSIKFPSAFSDDHREVELQGEAYFEVAQIQRKDRKFVPFIVNSQKQRVEVLGTHFNVNSYENEEIAMTTLLEGSVRIVSTGAKAEKLLKPGQQSAMKNGKIDVQMADLESSMAWKSGDFIFNKEDLLSIMKKIERWYDVEVVYQGAEHDLKFSGAVSRARNLSEVLKIMESTGKVGFEIQGRRVLVKT